MALALSLAGVAVAVRGVDFGRLTQALTGAQPAWLAAALAASLTTLLAKAVRWRGLFTTSAPPTAPRALAAQSVGMALNALMPARLGDLARAAAVAPAEGAAYALGTIALEKVLDLVGLAVVALWLLTTMAFPEWLPAGWIAAAAALAASTAFLGNARADALVRLAGRAAAVLPLPVSTWLIRQLTRALAGLDAIRRPAALARALAWSAAIWALGIWTNTLAWAALGFDWPPQTALALWVVLQAGVTIPAGLARIGVFHALVVLCLGVFAIDASTALGYAVVLHLVVYLPIAALGALGAWWLPAPAHPVAATPARQAGEAPAHPVAATPARQAGEAPAHPVAATPARQAGEAPAHPIAATPARQAGEAPAHPIAATPARQAGEAPGEQAGGAPP